MCHHRYDAKYCVTISYQLPTDLSIVKDGDLNEKDTKEKTAKSLQRDGL